MLYILYTLHFYFIISHLPTIILYRTYSEMRSNYSTIELGAEELIEYKNEMLYSIYFGFLLHYITLTTYYIVQDISR